MKLRKIAKYLDWEPEVTLWIDDKEVWHGSMLDIHAAMNKDGDKKQYIKDCLSDGDHEAVKKVKEVEKYLDYKLDKGDIEYTGVSTRTFTNKKGAHLIMLDITLKEK